MVAAAGNPQAIERIERVVRRRIRTARAASAVFVLIGGLFIVLACALGKAPLAITSIALGLYGATSVAALALAHLHGAVHFSYLFGMKAVVVVGLVDAVRTAIAYRRGSRAQSLAGHAKPAPPASSLDAPNIEPWATRIDSAGAYRI